MEGQAASIHLSSLPRELIQQIITYLDRADLRVLNLASHALHTLTFHAFWTDVSLRTSQMRAHAGFINACKRRAEVQNVIQSLNVLDDRSCSSFIRSLEDPEPPPAPFYCNEDRALARKIWNIVPRLPSLKTLRTIAPPGDSEVMHRDFNLSNLETLELTFSELSEQKLGLLLSKTPRLRRLRVDLVRLIPQNIPQTHTGQHGPVQHLTSVRKRGPVINSHELSNALKHVRRTLEMLTISISSNRVQHEMPVEGGEPVTCDHRLQIADRLASFKSYPKLTYLEIPVALLYGSRDSMDDPSNYSSKLERYLPTSLEHFVLRNDLAQFWLNSSVLYSNKWSCWFTESRTDLREFAPVLKLVVFRLTRAMGRASSHTAKVIYSWRSTRDHSEASILRRTLMDLEGVRERLASQGLEFHIVRDEKDDPVAKFATLNR